VRLAYIVSRYPSISHVFILREVLALRGLGVGVDTFAVRRDGDDELLSDVDREEDARTYVIVPPRPAELIAAHALALTRRPGRYLSTLGLALRLRGRGPRAALWQVFYFGEAVLVWRQCQRRGIRHIHAHHANVGSDVALLASHLGGEGWSWSFTMHGSTEFFDVREHRLAQKTELALFVVCVSQHGRSQIMSLVGTEHWDKLRVVHCGVDPSLFALPERAGEDGPFGILTVGRVVPVKGQTLLVESVAELARRGLDARLTIVGDGPQLPELRALAERLGVSDRVAFAGAVGQDEIRAYYAAADVFALPSFAEGLPVVLIEAMAMGLPVVASRITGIPELVEEGVSGLLVVPGSGSDLTDSLARLMGETAEERRAMGRAGREKVVAEFQLEQTARQLQDVFAAMVPSARA
jgi:glycosyltransferase involved in cell wall biosynthesis